MITFSRKKLVTALAAVTLLLTAGLYAVAQQRTVTVEGQKLHILPATLETTQWGWLDPNEPPKLTMKSGELVAIETMMHSHNQITPGTPMEEIVRLRLANPGGGPHSVTGPVIVEEAEPGDVMEIRIKKIVPKAFGVNFNLPGKQFPKVGGLQEFFPTGFVRYFYLDWDKKQTEFKPGITVDLQPFPGILAVGIDPDDPPSSRKGGSKDKMAPVSTLRPWKNASNLDLNELQEGSILYVPVFLKGGLIWAGDAHCRQGNNEVNLTAIECAFREIVLQPIVRKDMKLTWPRAETPTHWILMGFHEDLNQAFKLAAKETVDFIVEKFKVTPHEAYSLTSILADCRVTQVVDIRQGVHCMVPKKNFAAKK
jgi:acetamidase/formamidase